MSDDETMPGWSNTLEPEPEVNERQERHQRRMLRLRVSIARDLTEILSLYGDLETEAIHHYADKSMPGGDALVMLGPVANLEAWNYRQLSELMGRTHAGISMDDRKDDPAPPLLVLAGWVDIIRQERDQPTDLRATIKREADYLRNSLDWLISSDINGDATFLAVDELSRDLHDVVRRLEDVLHDGIRPETTRVTCTMDDCDEKPRLTKVYSDVHPKYDGWKCPACREDYDQTEYLSAQAQHMHSEAAEDAWVTVADAAHSISRPANTIRTWIKNWRVSTQVVGSRPTTIYVYWPEVRIADQEARLITVRRKGHAA